MTDDDDPPIDLDRFLDAALAGTPGELFPEAPGNDPEHDGWIARGVGPTDCRNRAGVRPCPFVGCRSHLLLDVIETARAEPNLTISRARLPMFAPPPVAPGQPDPSQGRRRELAPTVPLGSAEDLAFQRRALERLWELPETCARSGVAGGLSVRDVARRLGAEEDEVGSDLDDVLCALRGAAIAAGADPEDEDAVSEMLGLLA